MFVQLFILMTLSDTKQWILYLVDSEDLLSLEVLITEFLTRESQFPDNVSLVILFNNINLFLWFV